MGCRQSGAGKLKLGIDRQAERVVSDNDHGPVFSKRPQPGQHHPGHDPGQSDLQIDEPKPRQRSMAEGGGQTVKGGIDGLKSRPGGDDHKGCGHKGLSDDNADHRIGEVFVRNAARGSCTDRSDK